MDPRAEIGMTPMCPFLFAPRVGASAVVVSHTSALSFAPGRSLFRPDGISFICPSSFKAVFGA